MEVQALFISEHIGSYFTTKDGEVKLLTRVNLNFGKDIGMHITAWSHDDTAHLYDPSDTIIVH